MAVARALCMKPDILLFDEPTSALDPEMIGEALEVMVSLVQEGMTMICVTHKIGFARKVAAWVIFMDAGEVTKEDDAASFFDNPKDEGTRPFLNKCSCTSDC